MALSGESGTVKYPVVLYLDPYTGSWTRDDCDFISFYTMFHVIFCYFCILGKCQHVEDDTGDSISAPRHVASHFGSIEAIGESLPWWRMEFAHKSQPTNFSRYFGSLQKAYRLQN